MENNNNDNNYNERVNANKEYINNYGQINNRKNNTTNKDIDNITNNYTRDNSNKDKLTIQILATIFCFVIFVVQFQSFTLFLISMLFVLLLGRNFFKVIGKLITILAVIIIIAFGLCFFIAVGSGF